MALTPEWSNRIERWREELGKHIFRPVRAVPVEAFFTTEELSYEQAMRVRFRPVAPGYRWGRMWEYGWFRSNVVIPRECRGERVELKYDMGGESLAFVNGVAVGSHTWAILLSTNARGDERFLVMAESYAGHGPTPVTVGPVPPGVQTVPVVKGPQCAVKEATLGVRVSDAFHLWLDVRTLMEIAENGDPNSLRTAEIHAGLRDFATIVDFELPYDRMVETFRQARRRLRPLLACRNGSTAPLMFAVGHGHLDVAWLWPLAETRRKAARTLANQLVLAQEYPEHRFIHSQAHLFRFVKDHYPELYRRVKRAVAEGTVIAEGGMWVEADTNISGGEALVRQFIHGRRFFRDEFGVESRLLWLPDVFGYSGNLPQILRGCGIDFFATAKIFWNYNGGEIFPYNTFWWEGIDGSRVLAHLMNDYSSQTSPRFVIQRWNERVQKDGISTRLMPFGWGDGGGGPTREHLEFARRLKDCEGVPRLRLASPIEFFEDQKKRGMPPVVYVGELYFQAHRGTYTSQAKVKWGNRKSELALREAEFWGCVARVLARLPFKAATLDDAWKRVLLCQFHDVLPGSSIKRVYDEAWQTHSAVIAEARAVVARATRALVRPGPDSLTVFNSLSHERRALITLPNGFEGARVEGGGAVPVQKTRGGLMAEVSVPACGWVTLRKAQAVAAGENHIRVTPRLLENELLRVRFTAAGEISSVYDKESRRELAADTCNRMLMYKDVPGNWDAWDIDSLYECTPVRLAQEARVSVIAAGPLVGTLKVVRRLNDSVMTQEISLRRRSRRLDFVTRIEWRERHKMLKVSFPVNVYANEAIHEIQMGHLRRPNHRSRQFDIDRFEVCNHKWTALAEENCGCAVLNDCKYGVNVLGNRINLTLLRAPLAPDMYADQGPHEFTYSFYSWNGSFAASGLVAEAYDLNIPVVTAPGEGGRRALFSIDAGNIVIETVKPAEDNSGDIVVRLYESKRCATVCTLAVNLPVVGAEFTDMQERPAGTAKIAGGRIALSFRPFEIKTIRLRMR